MARHVVDDATGRARILVTRPPHQQFQHYRSEINSLFGQAIIYATAVGFVGFLRDDSCAFQTTQTVGQNVGCDSLTRLLKLLERPVATNHQVANDQQRPAIAESLERDADGASGTRFRFRLSGHGGEQ